MLHLQNLQRPLRAQVREGTMSENREALLSALQDARRRQGYLHRRLTAECSMTSCSVIEVPLMVRESLARKLMQPPLKCPRSGQEAVFVRLDS